MDKQQKYDRQLRLWGDDGQRLLGDAKICLINVTATSTEILKNIVLAGIGSFTIIDPSRMTGEDAGSNFFLNAERIGESRARVATELLLELNPDVSGESIEETVDELLLRNSVIFSHFTIVIVSGFLNEETLLQLASLLWEKQIPLVLCQANGFLGYARLVIAEHCVVDSHPDNSHDDLRLDRPFAGLQEFCDSLDLDSMTYKEHSHVPYVVLLYKYLKKWITENGQMPRNWKEKKEFKSFLMSGVRSKDSTGGIAEEENFLEAVKHTNASLVPTNIPSSVQEILNDPKCSTLELSSKNFWILANALKLFTANEGEGLLPVRGDLPDMTSDSERYIKLQSVYKHKADIDRSAFTEHVSSVCSDLGIDNGRVSPHEIKKFCKNSSFLRVVRSRSLAEEFSSPSKSIVESLLSDPESNSSWYLIFRALSKFYTKYRRLPGSNEAVVEPDIGRLKLCVREILDDWKLPNASEVIKDDYIHEMVRYGASELHAVASFLGGTVAHEVVKLVTAQYVPFTDTIIYNGLNCTTTIFEA